MKRMTKISLLASLAVATVAATPALAQDAPERPFEGFYVGASVGFDPQSNDIGEGVSFDRNLDGTFGDIISTTAGANAFSPGFCNGAANANIPTEGCRNDRDALSYSGRIGGDIQRGPFVFGAVAEFGRSEVRDSVSAFSTTPASYTLTRQIDYDINLRARAGFAAHNTLFYVTGGGAYAKVKNSFTTTNTANSFTLRGEDGRFGFVAGGGIEQKISRHISFGLEYMYNQYNDGDFRVRVGQGTAPLTNPFLLSTVQGTDFRRTDDRFRWHSARFTVNYRF